VSKNGFFNAGRFAFPELGKSSYIEIEMIPKALTSTFQANTGNSFSTGNVTVQIPANAIASANGQAYSGTVHAFAIGLDPNDPKTYDWMPGDLRARDAGGYAKMLNTFGMFAVELESPSGEKLNLLPGKTAAIEMIVPSNLFSAAPEVIPVWHFDETTGYWQEEGAASRSGSDHYSFEVPHFSFWNCDVPADYILLNGHLSDNAGHSLTDIHVSLSDETFGTGHGYSNSEGNFGGAVPANVPLHLVITNACGDILLDQVVGPFNQHTDLGDIQIAQLQTVTVKGTLLDCNSLPLAGGLALIEKRDTVFSAVIADENGHFSATFSDCVVFSPLLVTGYDLPTQLQSNPVEAIAIDGLADLGDFLLCNNLDQFMTYTINGVSKTLVTNLDVVFTGLDNGYVGAELDSLYFLVRFENLAMQQATIQNVQGTMYESGTLHFYGCDYCFTCNGAREVFNMAQPWAAQTSH
jgi:hypothetical protein